MIRRFRNAKILRAAIISGCFFICACENDIEKVNALTNKREMAEEAKNIEIIFSQGGKLKAKLTAPLMLRYQTDSAYIEFPKTLHVDFYDSTGNRESWLDARYGKYFESINKVLLKDSVKVINIKGDTLTTSELWWDQNAKKFYTDSVVRIITKDRYIRGGQGLEASQDLDWTLIKRPTGTVLVGASPL